MAITYYVEFITVPLAALVLAVLAPPFTNVSVSTWIAGYLLWVLIEYWMHRWLFHVRFRKAHWVHHRQPLAPHALSGLGTWAAQGALAGLTGALYGLGGTWGLALAGGLLVGYCSYIGTHHLIHIEWFSPGSIIRQRHELHHRGYEKNYNVLNPLGDLVFGTYLEPQKRN